MNPSRNSKWGIFVAVLALIGLTAGTLGTLKARQKLGKPGLQLAERPIFDEEGKIVGPVSVRLPERVGDYFSTNLPITQMELGYLPKDTTYGRRRYVRRDGAYVDASAVMMGADRTSIHKPEICLVGAGWRMNGPVLLSVRVERPNPYDLPVARLFASKQVRMSDDAVREIRAVYVYWFVSEKRITASHRERFWYSLQDLVTTGVMPRWAYVSCFAVCLPGEEEATYARMKEFIAAAVPEFQLVNQPARSTVPPATASLR